MVVIKGFLKNQDFASFFLGCFFTTSFKSSWWLNQPNSKKYARQYFGVNMNNSHLKPSPQLPQVIRGEKFPNIQKKTHHYPKLVGGFNPFEKY